jgi:hypothetical protein
VTPAEILGRVLPRWRANLPPRYSRADVDGFVRRHRRELESLVAGALARRRAEAGHRPTTVEEFAAYDPIVTRERIHDAESDGDVLARLMKRIDAEFATGRYIEASVLSNVGLEYVDARTEAILVRVEGWDAVPLLSDSPALAIVGGGAMIALRDHMGGLATRPDKFGQINHLFAALRRSEEQVLHMREEMRLEWNTKERLRRYALAIWVGARAYASQFTLPIRTSP